MDLTFSEEQRALRDSVRGVCARHCGLDVVRKLENDPLGVASLLWSQLGELGVLGLIVPESLGGGGAGLMEAAIVAEELGAALAPVPFLVSSVLASGLLRRTAAATGHQLVTALARGERLATVAWLEPDRGFGPAGVTTRADLDGTTARLTGVKRHVVVARAADELLVLARAGDEVVLALTEPNGAGVELEQQLTVAGDTQYQVRFQDAPARLLATDGVWAAWTRTMLDGLVVCAAQAVGGARAALALTVDYARTREQFGRPLAGFQSIAHYLADAATAVDGAQTLAWQAAWAGAAGGGAHRGLDRLAPMAKLFACQTFREVTAMAQQVHGGMGFTVDCDIQLYFRRAKSLQLNWYDPRTLEELVATAVIDS